MIRYIGIDVHKRVAELCALDRKGTVLWRQRVAVNRVVLQAFANKHLTRKDRVALEATTNTWAVVELLEPFVHSVTVSNPLRTKAIAEAKIKTDKVDAHVLAQLLRTDFLPDVWKPDAATRQLRHITSRRASLVGQRTAIKNRIHAVLHQRLIESPVTDLFSKKGVDWLIRLDLDPEGRAAIDSELRLLTAIDAELRLLDLELAKRSYRNDQVKLLMTLPGVDVGVATALVAALGDFSRFKDGKRAASYLGLVPRVKQSADNCYMGPITKQGRSHARWMMVQAAQQIGRHPGPLGVSFRRLAKKKNRNVAVVATARKLVMIAWHMVQHNEPYRYAQPRSTQTKLARLRVKATGKRRRPPSTKGQPKPKPSGGTRLIPALENVYASEGLPDVASPDALSQGEQAHLRRTHTKAFANSISKPRRVPRRVQEDSHE